MEGSGFLGLGFGGFRVLGLGVYLGFPCLVFLALVEPTFLSLGF